MNNLVAIVGRPNVGKSTLFNRFTESRDAIIDPESGVTRDRKYGTVSWGGREFNVIDTGGYATKSDDKFEAQIREQVMISLEEADLILFVLDSTTGITDYDLSLSKILRRSDKEIIIVSNKIDTSDKLHLSSEFYSLGMGDEVVSVSANNGFGTGDLLDLIMEKLPVRPVEEASDVPRIAIVGKPNVGKSTFINTILDQDRSIVTEIAGTTRDATDTPFNMFGFDLIITDTAGLRKKPKIQDSLEFYSSIRTINAIERCDVCILLIDATEDVGKQDLSIFFQVVKAKKGIVLVVNKWDLVEKTQTTHDEFLTRIKERISPFVDVPIIFTSNITKQRVLKALELSLEVFENRKKRIPTSKLNDVLLEAIERHPPPSLKGKHIKIKYVTQLPSNSPAFAFFCNLPQYIKDPYKRFLENKIRENFEFTGVPIRIFFRKK
jgi:GTP-binding protein